ncbi:MAG: peptidylprolyl isomerase, partial [Chloroflexota bacterium]
PIAVRVNEVPIYMLEFEREMLRYKLAITDTSTTTLEIANEMVLDYLIDLELMRQGATQLGVTVSDEEIDNELERIEELVDDLSLAEWIDHEGYTEDEYRIALEPHLLAAKVAEKLASDVPMQQEQVKARHIVVTTMEEAQSLKVRLEAGELFEDLALENSLDESSRYLGGDLGWFPRGIGDPDFESAAFALTVGTLSNIIETKLGYHLIEALDHKDSYPVSESYLARLQQLAFEDWFEELKNSAEIEPVDPLP